MLRLKSQLMFSDASQTGWCETFDFTTGIFGFPMISTQREHFSRKTDILLLPDIFLWKDQKNVFHLFSNRTYRSLLVNGKYLLSLKLLPIEKRTVPFGPLRWDPVTVRSRHGEHLN